MRTLESGAKEKAIDLVNMFTGVEIDDDNNSFGLSKNESKQLAIIHINEMLSVAVVEDVIVGFGEEADLISGRTFYEEVIKQLEKLNLD